MNIKKLLEPMIGIVSMVIFGSVFYGIIYFLFGWKGIEWSHPAFWVNQLGRGCGTADANDWVGRWSESVHRVAAEKGFEQLFTEDFGQDVEVDLSTTYEFDSDGTFEWKTTCVIQGEGLSLSGGSIIRGSYTLDGDSYLIEIGGQEDIEVKGLFATQESIIYLANTTRSGTWVRDGDTLTLTDNDNIVEVLKKE